MKLAYWMYVGPAHVGTLRVASSFKNVHAIMHAPLGDDYFNVMRSMFNREREFTPVTASVVDRHVLARGSQEKVIDTILRKDQEECPDLIILTPTCTSSILQEDLHNFAEQASLKSKSKVLLADVNHYRVNEMQAMDRTLEQIVQFYIEDGEATRCIGSREPSVRQSRKTEEPSVNIIGMFTLGFHNQHDCRELKRLFKDLGIRVHQVIPEGGDIKKLKDLPAAWCNIVPYREVGLKTAHYLKDEFDMPYIDAIPMGILGMKTFIEELQTVFNGLKPELAFDFNDYIVRQTTFISQSAWFSRSIDCQNLTGKKAVVFGNATHASSITKILVQEMGIKVVCAGTYCKHDSEWFTERVKDYCDEVLITDDQTVVSDMIARVEPAAIFGTQMERHIGKRFDIPCGVISEPIHIQNFPLGYRPFLGYEGTNQIADLVYNSFALGMEDHLLEIFGGHDTKEMVVKPIESNGLSWSLEALEELNRIPGFVRGKVKRNTEKYARSENLSEVSLDVMFSAKEAMAV